MSCSLMFSGISSRSGRLRNFPVIDASSNSNHDEEPYLAVESESEITSRDLERSLTPTSSPGLSV